MFSGSSYDDRIVVGEQYSTVIHAALFASPFSFVADTSTFMNSLADYYDKKRE